MVDNLTTDDEWYPAKKKPIEVDVCGPYHDPQVVETLEGDYEVDEQYIDEHDGFYIIRGIDDETYPIGADIFEKTYDPQIKLITVTVEPVERDIEFVIDSSDLHIEYNWNRGTGYSVVFKLGEKPVWLGEPVEATVEVESIKEIETEVIRGRSRLREVKHGTVTVEIAE